YPFRLFAHHVPVDDSGFGDVPQAASMLAVRTATTTLRTVFRTIFIVDATPKRCGEGAAPRAGSRGAPVVERGRDGIARARGGKGGSSRRGAPRLARRAQKRALNGRAAPRPCAPSRARPGPRARGPRPPGRGS